MTFLFVGSQVCLQLPSDIPSRVCPCSWLVVVVTRLQYFRAFERWFHHRGLSPHKFTPMPGVHNPIGAGYREILVVMKRF
ncbi:hypothetical protein H6G00_01050 [Leptolyngbya sp. FACHB-541]|uniref:hypothetical protein n=1 Tax=Leptolyngbya sp. FACHB-541 TaxID=2692810 RepID=UPI0016891887|nr:hypothetical protein [Leptolyngbya sp. FACHB-541]MBD1995216.1 hypothetical protein [Leptolyngbya sp. FACHB-541]